MTQQAPPPMPNQKSGMSGKTKGCLGCLGIGVIGFIGLLIVGMIGSNQLKDDFTENKATIIADMNAAIETGDHARAVEIGKPYESVGDYEFKEVFSTAKKVVDAADAEERASQQAAAAAERTAAADAAAERKAAADAAAMAAAAPASIGDTVKFSDSAWTVTEARDLGSTLAGNAFTEAKRSEGKFIYVRFKVTNNTNEEQMVLFTPAVRDSKGRRFEELNDLEFYLPEGQSGMTMEQLPSGLPKAFSAIFEVPADATGMMFLARNFAAFGKEEKDIELGF